MLNSRLRGNKLIVVAMLGLHAALVLANLWQNSLVVDEPYHIASGISHFTERNFRADQVNPPLARMISVLPLLVAPPAFDRALISNEPGARAEWRIGSSWVTSNGPAVVAQTRLARLSGIGWSTLGGWLLYRLARRHRGRGAATLALALWCFDPTIIALAAVTTADLPAAVAAIAAASAFDRLLDVERARANWARRVVAGVWLGIALLVKFTLLVLPAYWLVWATCRRAGTATGAGRPGAHFLWRCPAWLAVVAVAIAVVNAGYGFQGSFRTLGSYRFVSATFGGPLVDAGDRPVPGVWDNRFRATILGRLPIPLPEDFVLGIDVQRRDFEHPYPSYLNGHWSEHGWWWFYIYAIELKEPIPWICTLALASLHLLSRRGPRRDRRGTAWLEALGLVLFAFVSSQVGFSHHLRYILPAYPFMILFMSRIAHRNIYNRVVRSILIGWLASIAVASSPNCLSYFNPLCGGPPAGHRYLLFSNVDWGQGAIQLRRWIDDHPEARPLYVSCSGPAPPKAYGIIAPPVPRSPRGRPSPGYYAVAAALLHNPHEDDYGYLRQHEPLISLGGSILIYRFDR